MVKLKKNRQGPSESATLFDEGTIKKGNDGKNWIITVTTAGVHRWLRVNNNLSRNQSSQKSQKPQNNKTLKMAHGTIKLSQAALVKMTKKYHVTSSGTKKQLAERLWQISGSTMSAKDLNKIVNLLSNQNQKKVKYEIKKQIDQPVTDYKGLWYPKPKPLTQMSRSELVKHIRKFRDNYEKITGRNQDLNDDRIKEDTDMALRARLKWYFSDAARTQSEKWLRREQ
jgi:hypothetical protein